MAESTLIQNGDTKQPTLPEATMIWRNDLLWSWINTELAKEEAKRLGEDPIHYACTVVPIPPGYDVIMPHLAQYIFWWQITPWVSRLRDVWGYAG